MPTSPPSCPQLRLFFACWPTAALQQQLHTLGVELRQQIGGRPTRQDNIHLTLAFIGDVPAQQLPTLQQLAAGISAAPFSLPLQQIGCWPQAGVGWLAPEQTPEALLQLVQQLSHGLQQAGFRSEKRRYRPHLTLLRKAIQGWHSTLAAPLIWQVEEFVLVASTLGASGPSYRIVGRWPLRG